MYLYYSFKADMNMPIENLSHDAASGVPELPDAEAVRVLLKKVVDPEMAINIVDLGLIYNIVVTAQRVLIDMTMTSPACPMGQMIIDDANEVLAEALPTGCEPEITLVWNPPWGPEMMSERSRREFGWSDD